MLQRVKDLCGYTIEALDGHLGKPHEFCFDDQTWELRYAVVEMGDWLLGHEVLISIDQFGPPDPNERKFPVLLTLQQVQDSPGIGTDKPVYLQHKNDVCAYLGLGAEMHMSGTWMISPLAAQLIDATEQERAQEHEGYDPHLRSTREVSGYHIEAIDGEIGHLEDFVVDDQTWQIGYIMIDTRNWLPGKKVMIAPQWIVKVRWSEKKVYVDLQCRTIEHSPEFDPESLRGESVR